MKPSKWFLAPLTAALCLQGCEKPNYLDTPAIPIPVYRSYYSSAYSDLESSVRKMYDYRAVFTWEQYRKLLATLSLPRFRVLPLEEMRRTYDNSRVVVGLRHDIDWNPFKAIEMAEIERKLGIRATYFILPTASYYGTIDRSGLVRSICMDSICIALYSRGAEIGIHNDLLTVMIEYNIDPFSFNNNELLFLNRLHIPVWGTSSHGSPIAKVTVPNYQIFTDFAKTKSVSYLGVDYPLGEHSLAEYGFKYEAYFIEFGEYYSESGGIWNDPTGLNGILSKLENSQPGDRIEILTHPDWWGKPDN